MILTQPKLNEWKASGLSNQEIITKCKSESLFIPITFRDQLSIKASAQKKPIQTMHFRFKKDVFNPAEKQNLSRPINFRFTPINFKALAAQGNKSKFMNKVLDEWRKLNGWRE